MAPQADHGKGVSAHGKVPTDREAQAAVDHGLAVRGDGPADDGVGLPKPWGTDADGLTALHRAPGLRRLGDDDQRPRPRHPGLGEPQRRVRSWMAGRAAMRPRSNRAATAHDCAPKPSTV